MAGERLEYWSTLPRSVLAERISREEIRHDLTFAETQLLDAARERLSKWRAPSSRSSGMNQEKKTEDQTEVKAEPVAKAKPQAQIDTVVAAVAAAEPDQPAVKAKAAPKKAKSKAAPAAKSAAPAASKKEAPVAKKTKSKTKAKSVVKAVSAKANSTGNGKRIPEDAVLKVHKSFKNPFKEGSGPYKRFEIIAKHNGKTYGALKTMASLKPTTPLNFVRAGGGEFISQGK
jgi:hypothetical protein